MSELDHLVSGGGLPSVSPEDARIAWLRSLGVEPEQLAGKIIAICSYKGGVGKTLLAMELAWLLGAVLVDLDWDRGNASRAWGYREEQRSTAPLLDALERGRTPRPLSGGQWRSDLVPCHSSFVDSQPDAETMATHLEAWAAEWGKERGVATVLDTHPGGVPSTHGAVAAAHVVVSPVILGEREMEAIEGMIEELKSFPLLLVPNWLPLSPPERYINWLGRVAKDAGVPVAPGLSTYPWLRTRSRRMTVSAAKASKRSDALRTELTKVAGRVARYVAAA